MSATIETLTKHRDGHRYATITSYEVEYTVKVVSRDSGKYTHVLIVGGDFPTYREVGILVRQGVGSYTVQFRRQDGSMGGGYRDSGKMLPFVETLVHTYVSDHEYFKREAAKSPEQVAQEQAAREASANQARNEAIARAAEKFMAEVLDRFVPETTVHYAVEDARQALSVLIREAKKGGIKTVAAPAVKS